MADVSGKPFLAGVSGKPFWLESVERLFCMADVSGKPFLAGVSRKFFSGWSQREAFFT